jgi:hypothetical protein
MSSVPKIHPRLPTMNHRHSQPSTKPFPAVLPLLVAGNFSNAFPPGYNTTLGADLSTLELYFRNLLDVVAALLRIQQNNMVAAKLRLYKTLTEDLLRRAEAVPEKEKAKLRAQSELQHKSWVAKVLILKSNLIPAQLTTLDGKIAECEHQISEYCKRIAAGWDTVEVPKDITEGAPATLEERLLDFLSHESEKVLLLNAPAGSHKTQASIFVAYRAWRDKNWVPVVVDLTQLQIIDEQFVALSLKSHQLDGDTILHAQATKNFLLVIEGFDKRNCQVNLYVRNRHVIGVCLWKLLILY